MKIEYQIDEAAINSKLRSEVTLLTDQAIKRLANEMMADGRYNYGNKKGIGYEIIEKAAYEYIDSEKAQELIRRTVEAHWERMFVEATMKAMQHQANKLAWQQAIRKKEA